MMTHPSTHDAGADPADARLAYFRFAERHDGSPWSECLKSTIVDDRSGEQGRRQIGGAGAWTITRQSLLFALEACLSRKSRFQHEVYPCPSAYKSLFWLWCVSCADCCWRRTCPLAAPPIARSNRRPGCTVSTSCRANPPNTTSTTKRPKSTESKSTRTRRTAT